MFAPSDCLVPHSIPNGDALRPRTSVCAHRQSTQCTGRRQAQSSRRLAGLGGPQPLPRAPASRKGERTPQVFPRVWRPRSDTLCLHRWFSQEGSQGAGRCVGVAGHIRRICADPGRFPLDFALRSAIFTDVLHRASSALPSLPWARGALRSTPAAPLSGIHPQPICWRAGTISEEGRRAGVPMT